jgi:AcrR family transcriptional regulator
MSRSDESGNGLNSPAPGLPTRQALINATLAIMATHGEDAVRVAVVARDAGVTTGALYAHFANREEIIGAAHIEFLRRAIEQLRMRTPAVEITQDMDPTHTEALRPYMRMLLSPEELAERRRWAEAAVAGHRSRGLKDDLRGVMRLFVEESRQLVEASQQAGWTDASVDAAAIATLELATVVGLSLFADLYDESPEFKDSLADAWARLPSAMAPRPAPVVDPVDEIAGN